MFEVRCIVGDKKLSDVLRALKGHTIEHPVVIPVSEAGGESNSGTFDYTVPAQAPKKPKKAKTPRRGGYHMKDKGAKQVVLDLISRSGAIRISAREMKRATVAAGYSTGAYSHALKLLVADRTLRAIAGSRGDYDVIQSETAPVHKVIQHG